MSDKGIESYLGSDIVHEHGLGLTVFDTLYWVDKQVIDLPLTERRKITQGIQEPKIVPSTQHIITDPRELGCLFEDLVKGNYEGLVCKNPSSLYVPGAKTKDWIKVKRAETMDLVVLGVYYEQGAIGQVLCGTYNDMTQQFETLARVNAKREGYNSEIAQLLEGKLRKTPLQTEVKRGLDVPEYFVNPLESVVIEVAAMNIQRTNNVHSCGLGEDGKTYSLRIAWLKDIRYDKKPLQATTTGNVGVMYGKQMSEGA
jgi:ATP-dependent DNA ligase